VRSDATSRRRHSKSWRDVRDFVLEEIRDRQVGEQLPSALQLAASLKCSLGPVLRALRTLQAEGYLSLGRGRRAYVLAREAAGVLGLGGLREFGDKIQVLSATVRLVEPGENRLVALAAQELAAPKETLVLVDRVRRLRIAVAADAAPVRWDRSFMVASRVPASFLAIDFSKPLPGLLTSQEKAGMKAVLQEFTLSGRLASEEEATKLGLPPRAPVPVLHVTRKAYDHSMAPTEYLAIVSYAWPVRYRYKLPLELGAERTSPPRSTKFFEREAAAMRALEE
jgi:GntR family transcriptional regulator